MHVVFSYRVMVRESYQLWKILFFISVNDNVDEDCNKKYVTCDILNESIAISM